MAQPSMYELTVLVCWRGLDGLVPVPGDAASRLNGMTPRSSRNVSIGSWLLNGMFTVPPPPCASPNVWSRNWPHSHPHWVTERSEKTFCPTSLKIRLLTNRVFGPVCRDDVPSL